MKPRLAARGLHLTEEAHFTELEGTASASGMSAQASNAVLRFRSAGIDRVITLDFAGLTNFLFMPVAESQGYHPRYGFHSLMQPSLRANVPAAQMAGMVGVGWRPNYDTGGAEGLSGPSYDWCVQALQKRKGYAAGEGTSYCDQFLFLRAAIEHAPRLTAEGIRARRRGHWRHELRRHIRRPLRPRSPRRHRRDPLLHLRRQLRVHPLHVRDHAGQGLNDVSRPTSTRSQRRPWRAMPCPASPWVSCAGGPPRSGATATPTWPRVDRSRPTRSSASPRCRRPSPRWPSCSSATRASSASTIRSSLHLRQFRVVAPGPDITIRHLLTHTSGLGEVRSLRDLLHLRTMATVGIPPGSQAPAPGDYYRKGLRPAGPAGVKWTYSNHAFNVLGAIVEDVSGERFDDYVGKRILEPFGLSDTTFRRADIDPLASPLATSARAAASSRPPISTWPSRRPAPGSRPQRTCAVTPKACSPPGGARAT